MEAPVTAMTAIIAAISDVVSVVGTVFTTITGNPLLLFYVAVGVLCTGIGVFSAIRNAAH